MRGGRVIIGMEGFILAAGLGTRLRPLTDDRPKALVEVQGHTLLEICIARLAAAGAGRVVVNVHHFGDMVVDYLQRRRWPCEVAVSYERAMLLDTGGALRHAAPLFTQGETVLVHNVDVLSTIDLGALAAAHTCSGNLATLCVSQRDTRRMLEFDAKGVLAGRTTGDSVLPEHHTALAFSGITMVSPELFHLLPEADHPYPIIDEYIRLAASGRRIGRYIHPRAEWLDVGKPETLKQAQQWNLF